MYYQIEWLANNKIQVVEEISSQAWKFTSIKKEGIFKNVVKMLSKSFETKRNQTENGSCVACQL